MTNTITTMTLLDAEKYCRIATLETLRDNIVEINRCLSAMYMYGSTWNMHFDEEGNPLMLKSQFQKVDDGMYEIAQDVDYKTDNMLYGDDGQPTRYIWPELPTDIKEEINRWFAWSNEQKGIIDNPDAQAGSQPLCDNNRELTYTSDNDIIFVEA